MFIVGTRRHQKHAVRAQCVAVLLQQADAGRPFARRPLCFTAELQMLLLIAHKYDIFMLTVFLDWRRAVW